MPIELARDFFVAFDDQECAVGIDDHDIRQRNGSFGLAFLQPKLPPVADTDQRGQGREQYSGQQSHTVLLVDRKRQQGDAHRAAENRQERYGAEGTGRDSGLGGIFADALASDRIGRERAAVVQ